MPTLQAGIWEAILNPGLTTWAKMLRPFRPCLSAQKALLCNQNQSMMSLLPLQGEHPRTTLPRVPVPLRVTSALGLGLVGLTGRARPLNNSRIMAVARICTMPIIEIGLCIFVRPSSGLKGQQDHSPGQRRRVSDAGALGDVAR